MVRSTVRATAIAAVTVAGVLAVPAAAQARVHVASVAAGRSAAAGTGHFVYDEPGTAGHRIWFGVQAVTTRDGSARGQFRYRHELPDGTLVAQGWADVTCLQVTGNVALVTAIVPEGEGPVRNHGFYVKIIDGGAGRDEISDVQASGGPERPPTGCVDPDDYHRPRYPVLAGGFAVHGG